MRGSAEHNIIFANEFCSMVRAFTHGAMGHKIDPSWGGPIELFPIPASANEWQQIWDFIYYITVKTIGISIGD